MAAVGKSRADGSSFREKTRAPTAQVPLAQFPDAQSSCVMQSRPLAQRQSLVPQGPDFGSHTLATQRPSRQRSDSQSESSRHSAPAAQRRSQSGPPQSSSVSAPFATSSLHSESSHSFRDVHRVSQSTSSTHGLPAPQGAHPPPQSTSVSKPSCVPLSQSPGAPPEPPRPELPPAPEPALPEAPPFGSPRPAAPLAPSSESSGANANSGHPQDAATAAAMSAPIPRMPAPRIGRFESTIRTSNESDRKC